MQDGFQLQRWLFLTSDGSKPEKPLSPRARSKFFQDAYELMSSNVGDMQAVIKALVQDGGIKRILELVKEDYATSRTTTPNDAFRSTILPFFKTVSHPKVLASGLLETSVVTIYNNIYGPGGKYAIRLFRVVASISETLSVEELQSTVVAFSKTLDTNGTAQLMEEFKQIAIILEATVGSIKNESGSLTMMNMRKWLDQAKTRLGMGKTITNRPATKKSSVARAQFEHRIDPPGHLSEHGPRHDNDHEDIRNIRILPTFQELHSERIPYLPVLDPRSLHLPGQEGLIDRQFRLYREDMVGPIRDAVKFELYRQAHPHITAKCSNQSQRTNRYTGIRLEQLYCDGRQGLLIIISVDQPQHLSHALWKKRKDWWEQTKRLKKDVLVSILDRTGHVLFCTVSEIRPDEKRGKDRDKVDEKEAPELTINSSDLYKDAKRVVLAVAPAEERDTTRIVEYFTLPLELKNFTLLEFPGVLLPAFQYTLGALQDMMRTVDLPFSELLAPEPVVSGHVDIEPPAYARQANFHFDLSCLLPHGEDLRLSPNLAFDLKALTAKSTLDTKQAETLVHLLSRCFALCQGPPGTGKSYTAVKLISTLLANKRAADLGPILLVTYTNHALDQIGEHLVDSGVKKLIRIGSQSKSERLVDLNLRVIAKDTERTRTEKHESYKCYQALKGAADYVNSAISEFDSRGSAETLKVHLQWSYYDVYQQFWGEDEEGWKNQKMSSKQIIQNWLTKSPQPPALRSWNRPTEKLLAENFNIWETSLPERHALHSFWVQECQENRTQTFLLAMKDYRTAKKEDNNAKGEVDMRCLEEADVVAITTSGLARNLRLLKRLPIKALLIEEAGEVLEAHTLTALLPSVEHAILIGDHFQLKPHVNNYDLSSESHRGKKFSLEISLFERLVNKQDDIPGVQLPFTTLEIQRRMHPSISALIRGPLYPHLQDAPNVSGYPQVAGVRKRLFWLDHSEPEAGEGMDDLVATSKSNDYEVEMCAALVSHILKQGVYRLRDIALITPYLGQLFKLRTRLASQFEVVLDDRDADALESAGIKASLLDALKVATIDNFQGEEAKVVIVSLVRSNKHRNCGFLKTSNRINVLLSRAMHGMYIIGNSATSATVPMWTQVVDMFKNNNNIGTALPLCCARHPDAQIEVSNPADFLRLCPEGGCNLLCDRRHACGHSCVRKCHSELQHANVKCLKDCHRMKPGCSHICRKFCGDDCDPRCEELRRNVNVVLGCGHVIKDLECWQYQARDSLKCMVLVKRMVKTCQHEVTVPCHVDVDSEEFKCTTPCGGNMKCGHACKPTLTYLPFYFSHVLGKALCHYCTSVYQGRHGECKSKCGRPYSNCKHQCAEFCHDGKPCGVCRQPCEIFCDHSRCDRECGRPCMPCAQDKCSSSCPHSQCNMPCSAPCDWIPCSKRCSKLLECGHRCPSLCGETCPAGEYCQECGSSEIKSLVVDFLEMTSYEDVNLDEDPLLVPRCGHAITMSSMDGSLAMSSVYEMNPDGTIRAIKASEPFSTDELKDLPGCPTCRGSLRNINRYGRLVRRVLLDESTKRFVTLAAKDFGILVDALYATQEELATSVAGPPKNKPLTNNIIALEGTPDAQFNTICKSTENWTRYQRIKDTRARLAQYYASVDVDSTPYARLYQLVEAARVRAGKAVASPFQNPVSQVSFHIMAKALLIRCDIVLLADVLKQFPKLRKGPLGLRIQLDTSVNRKECKGLITKAIEAKDYERAIEGHVFYARYCALERPFVLENREAAEMLKGNGEAHLEDAHSLVKAHGGKLKSLVPEIKDAEKLLNDGNFVSVVTSKERREILAAMAKEFSGTGHWYTCANGHPFTVGECGMPMEMARCPQCDAPIGGQHHRPTEGVVRAEELEKELASIRLGG
ncbi:P-loop containing nucleoside triphosphate hydrolase protein [Amniculicola lignicola CBS 123094]|uniref:P-loop containing nucleoside triphosphate hydrolase protein n=1 Tax=Amniculicola lignicola CBS 123094 TaxID=1392246 RepID=A0A6A5W337_9PLEO|nr:P-loop containing nucleoside triphosphate hydrolase protein [Amniculicola lignicola CBS 123094]